MQTRKYRVMLEERKLDNGLSAWAFKPLCHTGEVSLTTLAQLLGQTNSEAVSKFLGPDFKFINVGSKFRFVSYASLNRFFRGKFGKNLWLERTEADALLSPVYKNWFQFIHKGLLETVEIGRYKLYKLKDIEKILKRREKIEKLKEPFRKGNQEKIQGNSGK